MTPLREGLDPGVLVSGAISPGGPTDRILQAWQEEALDLVVSPRLLDELALVLRRDKFRSRLPRAYGEEFLSLVADLATLVPDPRAVPAVTRDPKDDYLPALARASAVDHLVSGDRRHLPPDSAATPPIITPGELVGLLDRRGASRRPGSRPSVPPGWARGAPGVAGGRERTGGNPAAGIAATDGRSVGLRAGARLRGAVGGSPRMAR